MGPSWYILANKFQLYMYLNFDVRVGTTWVLFSYMRLSGSSGALEVSF